jgi:hypothetical protein
LLSKDDSLRVIVSASTTEPLALQLVRSRFAQFSAALEATEARAAADCAAKAASAGRRQVAKQKQAARNAKDRGSGIGERRHLGNVVVYARRAAQAALAAVQLKWKAKQLSDWADSEGEKAQDLEGVLAKLGPDHLHGAGSGVLFASLGALGLAKKARFSSRTSVALSRGELGGAGNGEMQSVLRGNCAQHDSATTPQTPVSSQSIDSSERHLGLNEWDVVPVVVVPRDGVMRCGDRRRILRAQHSFLDCRQYYGLGRVDRIVVEPPQAVELIPLRLSRPKGDRGATKRLLGGESELAVPAQAPVACQSAGTMLARFSVAPACRFLSYDSPELERTDIVLGPGQQHGGGGSLEPYVEEPLCYCDCVCSPMSSFPELRGPPMTAEESSPVEASFAPPEPPGRPMAGEPVGAATDRSHGQLFQGQLYPPNAPFDVLAHIAQVDPGDEPHAEHAIPDSAAHTILRPPGAHDHPGWGSPDAYDHASALGVPIEPPAPGHPVVRDGHDHPGWGSPDAYDHASALGVPIEPPATGHPVVHDGHDTPLR